MATLDSVTALPLGRIPMVATPPQSVTSSPTQSIAIAWELLPDDYILPDDPVDNINQPAIAAALTDALATANLLNDNNFTCTNYGICATLNDRIVVKAPDWAFIPELRVPKADVVRSYTPQLQGSVPAVVMEFMSETEGTEYSIKPTYPPGKWFFYEQVLQVPTYAIFSPQSEILEVYRLGEDGHYAAADVDEQGRYWLPEMEVFLGVWQGDHAGRSGVWLRWWDSDGNVLLWGEELAAARLQIAEEARRKAEQESQRAEQEKQRAERLMAQLRAAGIEPEDG